MEETMAKLKEQLLNFGNMVSSNELATGDLLQIALIALGVLFGLLWLFLPFAIYGLKRRLDRMGRALEQSNESLEYSNRVLSRLLTEVDQAESK